MFLAARKGYSLASKTIDEKDYGTVNDYECLRKLYYSKFLSQGL